MRFRRYVVGIALALWLGCPAWAQEEQEVKVEKKDTPAAPLTAVEGCWVVKRILPTTNISALSQKEADGILGTRIIYSSLCVQSGKLVLRSPQSQRRVLTNLEFFREVTPIPMEQLGITEPTATMVSVSGEEDRGAAFVGDTVFLGGKSPVIEFRGVFFELKKAKPGRKDICSAWAQEDQETKVAKKDVPAAVLPAFAKAFPKATVKGYAREVEKGQTMYEVECVEGKTHRDVTFAPDGMLLLVEEEIEMSEVPEAVRQALEKKFPKAKVNIAEKIMAGKSVAYEFHLTTAEGKKTEVKFDAQGKEEKR